MVITKEGSIVESRFDTVDGRSIYSKRMGTVEPVFGHLRRVLHLDRFTLRSKLLGLQYQEDQ